MASINPNASSLAAQAQQTLPTAALASPYDGTNPAGSLPIMGTTGGMVPQLTGLGGQSGQPQMNATNQTAYAASGDVNQVVTNENNYTNRYYNIVVPNSTGIMGAWGGLGNLFGSWNTPGNSFVDPQTGVLYVQQETGITGWFKRLFRGY